MKKLTYIFILLFTQFVFAQDIVRTDDKTVAELIELAKETNHLDLSNRNLTHIPEEVYGLTELESLDISRNEITSLNYNDNKISGLVNLKDLYINSTQIREIPSEFSDLKNIQRLGFGVHLRYFPENISKSPLKVIYCKLDWSGVKNLEKLNIQEISISMESYGNRFGVFTKLPHNISLLKNLKIIRLNESFASLEDFELYNLKKLEVFDSDGVLINFGKNFNNKLRGVLYDNALNHIKTGDLYYNLTFINKQEPNNIVPYESVINANTYIVDKIDNSVFPHNVYENDFIIHNLNIVGFNLPDDIEIKALLKYLLNRKNGEIKNINLFFPEINSGEGVLKGSIEEYVKFLGKNINVSYHQVDTNN